MAKIVQKILLYQREVDYWPIIASRVVLHDQTLFRTEEEARDTPTGQLVTQGFN